jgi:uncharacterized protein YjbI with pentapeptide repeats
VLREVSLREADLRGVTFTACDLQAADLRGAKLAGADVRGCQVEGVQLTAPDAEGLVIDPSQAADIAGALGLRVRWRDDESGPGGDRREHS